MKDSWKIFYAPSVIRADIPVLPKTMQKRIRQAIEERLAHDPLQFGRPLRHSLYGQRRLRVGDWRVVYEIEADDKIININAIKHRKDIYEA